jgi:hypothetical protein
MPRVSAAADDEVVGRFQVASDRTFFSAVRVVRPHVE